MTSSLTIYNDSGYDMTCNIGPSGGGFAIFNYIATALTAISLAVKPLNVAVPKLTKINTRLAQNAIIIPGLKTATAITSNAATALNGVAAADTPIGVANTILGFIANAYAGSGYKDIKNGESHTWDGLTLSLIQKGHCVRNRLEGIKEIKIVSDEVMLDPIASGWCAGCDEVHTIKHWADENGYENEEITWIDPPEDISGWGEPDKPLPDPGNSAGIIIVNDTEFDFMCKVMPDEAAIKVFSIVAGVLLAVSLLVSSLGAAAPALATLGIWTSSVAVVLPGLKTAIAITALAKSVAGGVAAVNTVAGVINTINGFVLEDYKRKGFKAIAAGDRNGWIGFPPSWWQQGHCVRTRVDLDKMKMITDEVFMRPITSGALLGESREHTIQHWVEKHGFENERSTIIDPPNGIARWPDDKNTPLKDIPFKPDQTTWTNVGYRGSGNLPTTNDITQDDRCIISASTIQQPPYNVIPNDGKDDSAGLQAAIDDIRRACPGSYNQLSLIELPAGTINISTEIHVDVSYLIIRGQGDGPSGTKVEFRPGSDTIYDGIRDFKLNDMTAAENAKGGWIWPGRGAFRVQTREVHPDYAEAYDSAAPNRKDFYEGSTNFHWKSGVTLAQSAFMGNTKLRLESLDDFARGDYVWVGVPNSDVMYDLHGVKKRERICGFMYQQMFVVKQVLSESSSIMIDKPLEFDALVDPEEGVATGLGCTKGQSNSKVSRLNVVRGVGFENFLLTQVVDGIDESSASFNYNNLAKEQAMHGIVFKWTVDCFVRNIRTHMTGSHPIVTEYTKNMQFQDNVIHGSWNKGKGGNGYFRNSKIWDSLIQRNKVTEVRHITLQWSASGNVVKENFLETDLNLHGGWERHNLIEQNVVRVPYRHRDCSPNCKPDDGTWYPIFWAAGEHGGGWSGATGPRNVFFNNILKKQRVEEGPFETYAPYGENPGTIYQFGWDHIIPAGLGWEHLSVNGSHIAEWTHNEEVLYQVDPHEGINANCTHSGLSLVGVEYRESCGVNDGQVVPPVSPTVPPNSPVPPVTPLTPTPTPPPVPFQSDWCHKGTMDRSGKHCCGSTCDGQCGGSGCSGRPGGASECCTSKFQSVCTNALDTACVIPSPAPAPSPKQSGWCREGTMNGAGTHCCGSTCDGKCGGSGCSSRPGGASECCASKFQSECTNALDTACVIPSLAPAPTSTNKFGWCREGTMNGAGTHCCGSTCGGQCGGSGCSSRPGGASECCTSKFQSECTNALDTACIIPTSSHEWCRDGTLGGSGRFCCGPCGGQCGGSGCSSRPGGASECCTSGFDTRCSDPSDTACILP